MEMQNYVQGLLFDYNSMKKEIDALQYELRQFKPESTDETIAAMMFSSPQGERVDDSGLSDKTSAIALSYAQKQEQIENQALREITVRLLYLHATIDRLDFYMDKLPAHQATVLRNYCFEGYSWREIEGFTGVSYKTLVRHKASAIKALVQNYTLLEKLGLLNCSSTTPAQLL